tara:strand:- start:104 stop:328 length:225 start_codon:yes stop_codon:yes gene_type:complete
MANQLLCSCFTNNYNINFTNMTTMRQFGVLLKDMFTSQDKYFWIRVKRKQETKKQKENFIYKTIELLQNEIKIK